MSRVCLPNGWMAVLVAVVFSHNAARASQPDPNAAVDRGRRAVRTTLSPLAVSTRAYEDAWKQWGLGERPADYELAFRSRYGLHEVPYENGALPTGLHEIPGPFGIGRAIAHDCLLCHAGSIAGQTLIGLGNASLDFQSLYEDLSAGDLVSWKLPFNLSNGRGIIEASAGTTFLLQFRDAELNMQPAIELHYRDDLYQDIPAWWHLKRKKTMFHTGSTDVRSVRANLTFLLAPVNSAGYIKKHEPVVADIKAYLLTIEPPKYPFPIDQSLAASGERVFGKHCAKCHGTYGPDGVYPNKVVPIELVGTDPTLVNWVAGLSEKDKDYYSKSWLFRETGADGEPYHGLNGGGYQAPPLDGVWATGPYFHNGSVPTVYHVLNSESRPAVYTRSFATGPDEYDQDRLGWKITVLDQAPSAGLPAFERRKICDATRPGRSNRGHTFGDALAEHERMAVIEYLKTL
ncbi:MAG: hypothetical protein WD847_07240 [Pirellulales bacterium]